MNITQAKLLSVLVHICCAAPDASTPCCLSLYNQPLKRMFPAVPQAKLERAADRLGWCIARSIVAADRARKG